jgi:hypothetical protein
MATVPHIQWSAAQIDAECSREWGRYDRALGLHYRKYFEQHPELLGKQAHSATSISAALPDGWSHLGRRLPRAERHRHHLSGKSSQTLAVGLLGAAAELDPSLGWLWRAAGPLPEPASNAPKVRFEVPLDPDVLKEKPRVTAVDVLIDDPAVLICAEAKLSEKGLGQCSCADGEGDPTVGECSKRVLDRKAYWSAADEVLGLPDRVPPRPCPISSSYQAVRNVAAARALAGERHAVFVLIYDEKNPYFGGCGQWPGWATVLEEAASKTSAPDCCVRTVSWQALARLMPIDRAVAEWARDKHRLPARRQSGK